MTRAETGRKGVGSAGQMGFGRYAHQEDRAALAMLSSSCLVEICKSMSGLRWHEILPEGLDIERYGDPSHAAAAVRNLDGYRSQLLS